MLTGPDVSEHQASVDWKKVAGKHNLGVVRVADGDHRDSWYSEARVRGIREAGLLLAPYYFARVAFLRTASATARPRRRWRSISPSHGAGSGPAICR